MASFRASIFGLLRDGFTAECFDGEAFFSAAHPVEIDGKKKTFSNYQAGSEAPWFLLDDRPRHPPDHLAGTRGLRIPVPGRFEFAPRLHE